MVKVNPVRKKTYVRPNSSERRGFSNGVKIPQEMKWLFWSYDIASLDLEEDKEYIVAQVLNYGTWEDLKWLFKVYSREEIKKIVKNPQRGVWFKKVLNFWTKIFDIQLKKEVWEKAIFR